MTGGFTVAFRPVSDWEATGPTWQALAESDTGTPFFRSPEWMRTWMAHVPDRQRLVLFLAHEGVESVGAAMFYASRERTPLGVSQRVGHLQRTGEKRCDAITVEYAGPVAAQGRGRESFEALLAAFAAGMPGWDCLDLPGLDDATAAMVEARAKELGLWIVVTEDKPVYGVRLDRLGTQGGAYLAALGKNTRYQIRKSLRALEAKGRVHASEATSVEEAVAWFSRLVELHQASWQSRGQSGAFADPLTRRFHESLIVEAFASGDISLFRATAGDIEIGYLYNFKYNGTIYNYQAGMAIFDEPQIRPGLVAHYLAIEAARRDGFRHYDFMAGEAGHKPRMGEQTGRMRWLRLMRRGFVQDAEVLARYIKRWLAGDIRHKREEEAHG